MRGERFLVDNRAGWRLALTRYRETREPKGRPVLIVPGYGMNSFIFSFHPNGPSMVECLAARGLGLGTTLTTVFRSYQDEIKELTGMKPQHDIVALVPIGRPQGVFGVAPRKPAEKVTHWNQFGNRREFGMSE